MKKVTKISDLSLEEIENLKKVAKGWNLEYLIEYDKEKEAFTITFVEHEEKNKEEGEER